jgi:hypothetical protein
MKKVSIAIGQKAAFINYLLEHDISYDVVDKVGVFFDVDYGSKEYYDYELYMEDIDYLALKLVFDLKEKV